MTQALQQWQDLDQQLAQLRSAADGKRLKPIAPSQAAETRGITEELRPLQARWRLISI